MSSVAECSVPFQDTLGHKYGDWVCLGLRDIQFLAERVLGGALKVICVSSVPDLLVCAACVPARTSCVSKGVFGWWVLLFFRSSA